MTKSVQTRLVAILRDAMTAQGITQSELARHVGTSAGVISTAFSGKSQMREERWKMACEFCGVDYDKIMDREITPQSASGQLPYEGEPDNPVGATTGRPSHRAEQSRAEQSRAEPANKEEVHPMSVAKNTVSVELTADQCRVVKDFIEDMIFTVIRNDNDINNFSWLSSLVGAHHALAKAVTMHEKSTQ